MDNQVSSGQPNANDEIQLNYAKNNGAHLNIEDGCFNPSFESDCVQNRYVINNSNLYATSNIRDVQLRTLNKRDSDSTIQVQVPAINDKNKDEAGRENWGKSIEFLLSCIAMSVGLGNIWRFPISALRNGGGAFLIPYLIVLFLVGKPIYFLEMVLGQFYSRGCIKAFDFCPALRGVGFSQVISIFTVSTYYAPILAITMKYFFDSFSSDLPWSECHEWVDCTPSSQLNSFSNSSNKSLTSSAEIYFIKEVVKSKNDIDDGIGAPILNLVLFLAAAWIIIFLILIRGIKSSGKAAYVLAIFPYIVLFILFGRAITLPGAIDGIIFFLRPDFGAMLKPRVWFDAVSQVFFSLAVGFGCVTMYASFNKFDHNIYRDVNIVSVVDTCTSLLAGCTIFGVLGHLKYKTGNDDIFSSTGEGAGLVFITYPDAISKFDWFPQLFALLFFLMFFVLGVGSIISMTNCVMTVIRDKFPHIKNWQAALGVTLLGFSVGIVYVTPGGLNILDLVDFFGVSVVVFFFVIAEIIAVCWIYGVDRLCKDIKFMLGFHPGLYWRICWKYVTPAIMIVILIYNIVDFKVIKIGDNYFPTIAYIFGGCLSLLCLLPIPVFMCMELYKQTGFVEIIKSAFEPKQHWGPQDPALKNKYQSFINNGE